MDHTRALTDLMAEATRLTRQGRVAEATQAIQQALTLHQGNHPTPGSPVVSDLNGEVLEGLVREVETSAEPVSPPTVDPGEVPTQAPPASPSRAQPAPSPGRGRFEAFAYATAQGMREYKLYTPSRLPAEPAPLVVMLHGCKQNPDDFAAGTQMNALAEEQGFLVLYPAQAPRSNAQRCWNWFQPGDQQRGRGEPALLAGMTRHVIAEHGVDARRVYVAGLSAGGAMAAILAHEYPDLFAAAGVHSGLPKGAAHDVGSAFAAMKQGAKGATARAPVPLIVFHGDRDGTVHPVNGEQLVAGPGTPESQPGTTGDGRRYGRTTYRDASGRVVAEHWLVHGMGHAWSGGSAAGSYTQVGGPDATREMLRFFTEHRRS